MPKERIKKVCAVAVCPCPQQGTSYHRFPSNPGLRKKWISLTRRKDKFNVNSARICSKHFRAEDFQTPSLADVIPVKHPLLRPGACPSLLLKSSDYKEQGVSARAKRRASRCTTSDSKTERTDVQREEEINEVHPFEPSKSEDVISKDLSTIKHSTTDEMDQVDNAGENKCMKKQSLYEALSIIENEDVVSDPSEPLRKDLQQEVSSSAHETKSVEVQCRITLGRFDYEKRIHDLKRRLCQKQEQVTRLKKEVRMLRSKAHEEQVLQSRLKGKYTAAQIRKITNPKGHRVMNYEKEDITTALVLKSISNKAYNFLRVKDLFALPGPGTLVKWTRNLKIEPGIQSDALRIIQEQMDSSMPYDKLGVISFDEMEIRQKKENNIKSKRNNEDHNNLQVVLLKNLTGSWTQRIFFDFNIPMTRTLFEQIVTEVQKSTEILVVGVTFGLGDKRFIKECCLSEDKHWIPNPCNQREKIFAFPDAPHCLKLIRNHILDEGLELPDNSGTLSKSDFIEAMHLEVAGFKMNDKLTSQHITGKNYDRQRVDLAAQLLSKTNARMMYYLSGEEKKAQAEAIETIDGWFDVMNSSQKFHEDKLKCAFGIHFEEQMNALNKMEKLVSKCKVRGKGRQLWQKSIMMSIKSTIALFEDVKKKYGVQCVMTSHLNQDSVKNHNSQIRGLGGQNDNPSAFEAIHRMKLLLLGNDTESPIFDPSVQKDPDSSLNEMDSFLKSFCSEELESEEAKAVQELLNDPELQNA